MWTQFLNQSRSQHQFKNKNIIVLGSKHCGKRSLIDCLLDVSKTNLNNKRMGQATENNKMRMKGLTPAIDYAYLNVMDINDPDNRTHSKLEIFMLQQVQHPTVYSQLATTQFFKNSIFIIMLDFTAPWNFIAEIEKWVKFIYQLQKIAQISIADLQQMGKQIEKYYKQYKQPEFDQNGKLKTSFALSKQTMEEQLSLPLPQGVLSNNIRLPLLICVNKCDLQSQVLREESNTKILVILYHLRSLCVKYGSSLIYTSIRNNCNLNVLYEYVLHRAYHMPLRFKPQVINQQAIFIPLGYDNLNLIKDSIIKIDINRSFNDIIALPIHKKINKEEIIVQEDSKFFQRYISQGQSSTASETSFSEKQSEKPMQRKKEEVTGFFMNLLQGGSRRQSGRGQQPSQRLLNAQKELIKHTTQVMEKRNIQQ